MSEHDEHDESAWRAEHPDWAGFEHVLTFSELEPFVMAALNIDFRAFDEVAGAYGAMDPGLAVTHDEIDTALAHSAEQLADRYAGPPSQYESPSWFIEEMLRLVTATVEPATLDAARRAWPVEAGDGG